MIALDLETTISSSGLSDPYLDGIELVQLAFPDGTIKVERGITPAIREILQNPKYIFIIHNAPFDLRFLMRQEIKLSRVWDTLMVERILTAGKGQSCSLEDVVERRCGIVLNKNIRGSFRKGGSITPQQLEYAKDDVRYLHEIQRQQQKELIRENLVAIAELENSLTIVTASMTLSGVRLNKESWEEVVRVERAKTQECYQRFFSKVALKSFSPGLFQDHRAINLNSPIQVKEILADMGIQLRSTAESTLVTYLRSHPTHTIIQDLLDYREHSKRISWDYPKYINPVTDRIHPIFNQMGTDTARYSCSNPNLQNVPHLPMFRRLFQAESGNLLVTADASQIELRVIAKASKDQNMTEAFRKGIDIHLATADKIGSSRYLAKQLNFATIYGAGASTFASGAEISFQQAQRLQSQFFQVYSAIPIWAEEIIREAKVLGYTVNLFGRKRWFPSELLTSSTIDNTLRNTPIQSTAADIIKIAMIELDRILPETAKMILQIHDEIVIECPEEEAYEVSLLTKQIMETAGAGILEPVPLVADIQIGKTWEKQEEGDF